MYISTLGRGFNELCSKFGENIKQFKADSIFLKIFLGVPRMFNTYNQMESLIE